MPVTGLNPDALANVVHGYAEIDKETDDKIKTIHDVKAVSSERKVSGDEDYDGEDQFYHALMHNNDDKEVVDVSVSNDDDTMRVDEAMFAKLHKKLFVHEDETEDETDGAKNDAKFTYGAHELFEDGGGFE